MDKIYLLVMDEDGDSHASHFAAYPTEALAEADIARAREVTLEAWARFYLRDQWRAIYGEKDGSMTKWLKDRIQRAHFYALELEFRGGTDG